MLVELAASIPELELEVEPDFEAGVPAPVNPTQPESDSAARDAKIRATKLRGARQLESVFVWL